MDSILSEGKYRSSLADEWKEASRKRERERERNERNRLVTRKIPRD